MSIIDKGLASPTHKGIDKLKIPVTAVSTLTPSRVYTVPFEMDRQDIVNRIGLYIGLTQAAVLISLAIYDSDYNLVVNSEQREVPPAGYQEFNIPDTTLGVGLYYAALHLQAGVTTATFGTNTYMIGGIATSTTLPTTITANSVTYTVPALVVKAKEPIKLKGLFTMTTLTKAVWCLNGSTLWGSMGSNFYTSTDDAVTWTINMHYPTMVTDDAITDAFIYNSQLYMGTLFGHLYQSSDLTAGATWTDRTCPNLNVNATGRVLGFNGAFNSMIFQSEYSGAPNELSGGPTIHKFNPANNTWAKSGNFPNARHIHSIVIPGSAVMYISVGDSSYGADIGIWRLTAANLGTVNGLYADTWQKATSITSPNTANYGVDFIVQAGIVGIADGIYHASDRPSKHILFSKTTGTLGSFNMNAQLFATNTVGTETVRAIAYDTATKNMYWFTAETTDPVLYIAQVPYSQSYPLYTYPTLPAFFGRSIIYNGYLYNFTSKIKLEKFAGQ